ncbi:MAG: MFS transporter [Promethearchaeota archaeon]
MLLWAVDKLFFLDRGLELYQIAILLACWSGFSIILQIPTGALADKWSRKNMLVLSGVFSSLCFITWFFSSSFWLFLLGFLFLTICDTFVSGTLQAYVYDFLKSNGQEEEFERIWGRGTAHYLIGIAVAMLLGGFLSTHSYELVVGISAISPIVLVAVASLLPQTELLDSTKRKDYFLFIRLGIKRTFTHPIILRAFFYSALVSVVPGLLEEYDQVLLSSWLRLPNSFIGIWLALGIGASSVGALFAHRARKVSWLVLNSLAVSVSIILITVPFVNSTWLLGFLILLSTISGSAGVIIQGIIQREIDTVERATITSVNITGIEVSVILLGLVFGFIANSFGIQIGYGFCGLIPMIYPVGYLIFRRITMTNKE